MDALQVALVGGLRVDVAQGEAHAALLTMWIGASTARIPAREWHAAGCLMSGRQDARPPWGVVAWVQAA
jgi:hypothetical protein